MSRAELELIVNPTPAFNTTLKAPCVPPVVAGDKNTFVFAVTEVLAIAIVPATIAADVPSLAFAPVLMRSPFPAVPMIMLPFVAVISPRVAVIFPWVATIFPKVAVMFPCVATMFPRVVVMFPADASIFPAVDVIFVAAVRVATEGVSVPPMLSQVAIPPALEVKAKIVPAVLLTQTCPMIYPVSDAAGSLLAAMGMGNWLGVGIGKP